MNGWPHQGPRVSEQGSADTPLAVFNPRIRSSMSGGSVASRLRLLFPTPIRSPQIPRKYVRWIGKRSRMSQFLDLEEANSDGLGRAKAPGCFMVALMNGVR